MNAVGHRTNDKPITVRIKIADIPKGRSLDYGIWETHIFGKLKEAGIPVMESGVVSRGKIRRYDDPSDWDTTVYEWTP